MALTSGTRLGPYQILAPLGAGGMGEVYRAHDTRLGRDVALKILPADLSSDPGRKQRFEREAMTISSLNHPHICVLYDVGHQDGIDYLVMECVEGETLAKRLEKGPLPLVQVLKFGAQIGDGLDKAHRSGVVHRDLKPGNIMLTPTGAKLLDFGLAKTASPLAEIATLTAAAAQPAPVTAQGTIVGTIQYMSPEQIEGKELDARSDIFSFGAVLYEMLTGQRAFPGKSQLSVVSAILEKEPAPISTTKPMTPPALDRVIRRCLAKDPEERWQTARDIAIELKWIAKAGVQAGIAAPVVTRRQYRERLAWGVAAIAIIIALLATSAPYVRRAPSEPRTVRFTISPPEKSIFVTSPNLVSVSPDGKQLAFIVVDSTGKQLLWVRAVASLTAQPLLGTDDAFQPFWSPDGRFIAFSTQNKLKKIAITGGPPQTLAAIGEMVSGTWNREGVILFGPVTQTRLNTIQRVSAAGGTPAPVTTLDSSRQEDFHAWPHFLPDGKHFLYFAHSPNPENNAIYAGSLDSKDTKLLLHATSFILYSPPGYLLFMQGGSLLAQPFDADRLSIKGEALPIAEDVQFYPYNGRAAFSVSVNGVLVYRTGGALSGQLAWTDLSGKELARVGGDRSASPHFSLSPDESRIAFEMRTAQGRDLWLLDIARGTTSRFAPGLLSAGLIWSPDGNWLTFTASRAGVTGLYQKLSSGAGQEELLLRDPNGQPTDRSYDGRYLLYQTHDPKTGWDVWVLPFFGDRKPKPFLQSEFDESQGQFSPNGRWVAYTANESGRPEVYVQPFPGPGPKVQISTGGGMQPKWRRDGKELFYRIDSTGKLMAVEVKANGEFQAGMPRPLSVLSASSASHGMLSGDHYAVSADGKRVLTTRQNEESMATPITVVVNWTAELKKK